MDQSYSLTDVLDKLDYLAKNSHEKEEAMKNELFYASTVGVTEEKARKAVKSCKVCERIKLELLRHIEEIKTYRRAINDRRRR